MEPFDDKAMLQAATALHMKNEFQRAHDTYVDLIRRDPANAHALHLLGVLLLQNGFQKEGREAIEKAIALRGDYPEAVANLASFGGSVQAKWQQEFADVENSKTPEWSPYDGGTTDRWRHRRMVDFVQCFAGTDEAWLTIGDFKGYDSIMLREMGVTRVVASNLDASMLALGHAAGAVGEYQAINAEHIPLADNSFDYVLCKEALHHMPRPMAAIYEMLRVARKGIVFIEPQDPLIDWPAVKDHPFWRDLRDDKVAFGRIGSEAVMYSLLTDWYEDGPFNYVYTLSKREIRKISLGLGLPAYALKCFNDFYKAEWARQPAVPESEGFSKTAEQIQLFDTLTGATGIPCTYVTGFLFKQSPPPAILQGLQGLGYEFTYTPTRFLPLAWPKIE